MTEGLLEALRLIRETCKSKYDGKVYKCETCPLCTASGNCGLELPPYEWKLEKREVYF